MEALFRVNQRRHLPNSSKCLMLFQKQYVERKGIVIALFISRALASMALYIRRAASAVASVAVARQRRNSDAAL